MLRSERVALALRKKSKAQQRKQRACKIAESDSRDRVSVCGAQQETENHTAKSSVMNIRARDKGVLSQLSYIHKISIIAKSRA